MELSLDSLDSAQLRLEHRVVSLQDILQALLGLHVEDVYHSSLNLASQSQPNGWVHLRLHISQMEWRGRLCRPDPYPSGLTDDGN